MFCEQEFAQESIMQIILHQLASDVQVKAVSHSLDQNPKHPNTPTTKKKKQKLAYLKMELLLLLLRVDDLHSEKLKPSDGDHNLATHACS
jgi:hypothetical protein